MIHYSKIVEAVRNNQIKINIWGGANGTVRIFSVDGITFDGEQKACSPAFALKWDKFSLSLSYPVSGILKAKGMEVPTSMFKSKYVIKDGKPVVDSLYLEGDLSCLGLDTPRLSMSDIDFSMLYTALSFEDYMAATIQALEYGAEKKVIDHYNKSAAVSTLDLPGIDEEGMAYLKSIGLSDKGFNPKVDYMNGPQKSPIKVSIKSYGSIPSISSVITKMDNSKPLTPSESLIYTYLNKYSTATSENLNTASEIVKADLERAKDITRSTNYSVLYRGYNFGCEAGKMVEGNFNNYQISFEVNNDIQ